MGDCVDFHQEGFPPDADQRYSGIGIKRQAVSIARDRVSEPKPINIRLQNKAYPQVILKPRRYQVDLYETCLQQNTIIYLGTGLGKTFVIVLLLNSPQVSGRISKGQKVVFLAPTQDLVKQQAEYVASKVPYKVRVYCGRTSHLGIHIDHWKVDDWNAELAGIDILFMTPQIFSSAISVGFIKWFNLSVVIFDEVHHAATSRKEQNGKGVGHPYSQLLKNYKDIYSYQLTQIPFDEIHKPRFIGLTASLINNMPKTADCIRHGIEDLERKLAAKCVTDLTAIEKKPTMVICNYTKPSVTYLNDVLLEIFCTNSKILEEAVATSKVKRISLLGPKTEEEKEVVSYVNRLKLSSSGFSIKPASFHKVLKQLAAIRANSGLWTLSNVCYNLHSAIVAHSKSSVLSEEIRPMYVDFAAIIKKIFLSIECFLGPRPQNYLLDYSQPKLLCLLHLLEREYNRIIQGYTDKSTFSCIVFVQSRVEVFAVCGWLRHVSETIPGYDFLKVDYAIGLAATMASKWACITKRRAAEQGTMLDNFRTGVLNVIVTTSVLEEGIDLPVCSTIIRYDPAHTFRVYVQSRGRARQAASSFIAMCESDKAAETRLNLNKFNDFEERVKNYLKDNLSKSDTPSNRAPPKVHSGDERDDDYCFLDKERGIRVDSAMARIILHMYCARLARHCPYSDGLTYERQETSTGQYRTTLFFPPGCPVKDGAQGSPRPTTGAADNAAIIAAYRALYQSGELDERGVPLRKTEEHVDTILEKYNLKPNFAPLDSSLEGKVVKNGERELNVYPWRLCQLNTCLLRDFHVRSYKLYRINFKAASDDLVRRDTRQYFERQTLGLVVDGSRDPSAWPDRLYSHYGEFLVEYKLIDDNWNFHQYPLQNDCFKFTHRLVTNFWPVDKVKKDHFKEHCLFYVVPLNHRNEIPGFKLRNDLYCSQSDLDFGVDQVVKLNVLYRGHPGDHLKIFIVKAVHHNMNPYSVIPGSRSETFYERAADKYGDDIVRDFNQPIIEVIPISQAIARTSQGKLVAAEYQTNTIFMMKQFLDVFQCDIPTIYQSYMLPEIIYRIYLTTLGSDLSDQFLQATIEYRRDDTVMPPRLLLEYNREANASTDSEAREEDNDSNYDGKDDKDEQPQPMLTSDEGAPIPDDEFEGDEMDLDAYDEEGEDEDEDEMDESTSDSYGETSDDDLDEPKPVDYYKDILVRQKFLLSDRGNNPIEKWDMDEYNEVDLKTLQFEEMDCRYPQKYVNTSPRYDDAFLGLKAQVSQHIDNIMTRLREFRKGIKGNTELTGDDQIYSRPTCVVDISLEAPVKFDRVAGPFREAPSDLHFVEALTQRRAGERHNLEALENVGDSYLKYCVSVVLFKTLTTDDEGVLTNARSRLVSNRHFTHLAKKRKLGFYAIANKFDPRLLAAALGAPARPLENSMRPKDLADVFESIVGACLVYRGQFEAVMAMKWLGLDIFKTDNFVELHESAVVFEKPRVTWNYEDSASQELLEQCQDRVTRFQQCLKYQFTDRSYLVQAFTHATAPHRCTPSYERLEFLGDAILDFLVTMTLYQAGFTTDPGQITTSRSAIVNNCTFARLAIKYKYDLFLQHTNQEMYDELSKVNACAKADPELTFLDDFKFDRITKVLADIFESVAGGIFVDSGCSLDAVYRIYYPMMKETIDSEISNPTKNIVAQLWELFPGRDRIKIEFFDVATGQDDTEATSTCAKLTIVGLDSFFGEGMSKRQAKKRAVAQALDNLPSAEVKARLDKEFSQRLREMRGPGNRGRGGRGMRGTRGTRGMSGSRGMRGARGQRGRGGNYSRRNQEPYSERRYQGSGSGRYLR